LVDHLDERLGGRLVVDLLPTEHARAVDPAVRARPGWTRVVFQRDDGAAANTARTKVAKGRLVAALLARTDLVAEAVTAPALAATLDLGAGWTLSADGDGRLVATYRG
jgi:hypothetical protein